jgi:excisionase family DNA binding protein
MIETTTYSSLDQLPLTLRAEDIASVLGISRSAAYTLMHSKGFPLIYVGKLMRTNRDKFIQWMEDQASS